MFRRVLPVLAVLASVSSAAGQAPAQPSAAPAPERRYLIQPSDVLVLRYLHTPEYDHTGVVQPDGYLSAPVVGELKVGGLTLTQAHDAIVAAAARRLRDPEVYVDLKEFDKPRFTVGGEVGAPGRFELRGHTTVLEAIAVAGGLKPTSKHSQVLLLRPMDSERAAATLLDVKHIMTQSGAAGNVEIRPGDVLIVPQNLLSKIDRFVRWANVGFYVNPLNPLNR